MTDIRVFHDSSNSCSDVTVVGLWRRGCPVSAAHVDVPHRLGLLEYIPWWSYRERLQRALRRIRRIAEQEGGADA